MNKLNRTEFTTAKELASHLSPVTLTDESYEYGGVPIVVDGNTAYVDDTDSHTIIFGSTGSKKTRMFVMPTVEILSRAGESFFVSDPKGEVYERTAGGVKERGYAVNCLNLREFTKGTGWNPMTLPFDLYHAGQVNKALELIGDIVSVIFKTDSSNDKFWADTSVNVMTGFVMMMLNQCSREECNLKTLIRMWTDYRVDRKTFLKTVRERYKGTLVYNKLSCLDTPSDKTWGSIDTYVDMGINKLAINEDFVNYLSGRSCMELEEIAKNKSAVYLIVPDESDYYHFVVGLFVKQLYMVLISESQKNGLSTLEQRMNFILDEFCNIPRIPEFSNIITASRSRNIRFCLIVQSKRQLSDKYGEFAEVILGNCNNWIYLYSRETELLADLSQLCGEVIYENGIRTPLISMFELQHLSKEKGETLMLIGRNKPCISKMYDISEYPFVKVELSVQEQNLGNGAETNDIKTGCIYSEGTHNPYIYENIGRFVVRSYERRERESESWANTWLVATYQSMIIGQMDANDREIQNGKAMLRMFIQNPLLVEAKDDIEWYVGNEKGKKIYFETLEKHPEFVFLVMEEVGRRYFRVIREEYGEQDVIADGNEDDEPKPFLIPGSYRMPRRDFGTVRKPQ